MPLAGFKDRVDAGQRLAERLTGRHSEWAGDAGLLVLALPRGGVPVAAQVAECLGAPLDVLPVRKLGLPGQEELAMGAIASGGGRVLNEEVLRGAGVSAGELERVVARESRELARREREYRAGRAPLAAQGRVLVVVDDGAATGASMRAALATLRENRPARLVAAVPVASSEAVANLRPAADDVIAVIVPEFFLGVGRWYRDFRQVSDGEVRALLARPRSEASAARA